MKRHLLLVTLWIMLLAPGQVLHAQGGGDRDGVRRAVLDYVEGFYEGDTAKLVRSVRPDVVKYGYYIPKGKTAYAGEAMPRFDSVWKITQVLGSHHRRARRDFGALQRRLSRELQRL